MTEFIGYVTRPPRAERHGKMRKLWTGYMRVYRTLEAAEENRTFGAAGGPIQVVKLTLPGGAYFRVEGERDTIDGRGIQHLGNFIDYWIASETAIGKGPVGSFGYITIMIPEHRPVVAVGAGGAQITLAPVTSYRTDGIDEHLELLGATVLESMEFTPTGSSR